MRKLIVLTAIAILATACGGAGGASKMEIKAGGKDIGLSIKSSGTDKSVKTFTDIGGKVSTAISFSAYLANFEMDVTNVGTMRKPLTSADQVRLTLQLIGEEGTDQKSDLKPGIYKADPNGKFMKIDTVSVSTFADGKEAKIDLDTMFSGSKITGQVEVKTVTADSISGTIDVADGDKSVKGTFSAKIAAKK